MLVDKDRNVLQTVCKVKGFSLGHSTAAHINMKRMKRQVKLFVEGIDDPVTVYTPQIRRTLDHKIVTQTLRKIHRVVYNKRALSKKKKYETRPYGY